MLVSGIARIFSFGFIVESNGTIDLSPNKNNHDHDFLAIFIIRVMKN